MAKNKEFYYATGRRKTAIAKVKLVKGTGKITVNERDVHEYFPSEIQVLNLNQPLVLTETKEQFDVIANAHGGGYSGQAEAIRLGIARALMEYDTMDPTDPQSFRKILKVNGMITRDSRETERKKPGLKKARRAPQFSKR